MSENDELDEEKIIETVKALVGRILVLPISNLNWTFIRRESYLEVDGQSNFHFK